MAHFGERVYLVRRVVAPAAIPPRPPERRPKGFGEPMVRPTMVMLPAEAVVAQVEWALVDFGEPMVMATPPLPHPVVTAARVSAIPFQGVQSSTAEVVVVVPTTIRDFRPRSGVMEVQVEAERALVQTGLRVRPGRRTPAVVAVVVIRRDWVGRGDREWSLSATAQRHRLARSLSRVLPPRRFFRRFLVLSAEPTPIRTPRWCMESKAARRPPPQAKWPRRAPLEP